MADVRSLLRNERAARRINHPNASYSTTGKLSCSVCGITLQADLDTWNAHLKSTQHAMRAERLRLSQKSPTGALSERQKPPTAASNQNAKKRKATDDEEDDSRKRVKPVEPQSHSTTIVNYDEAEGGPSILPPPSPDPVKPATLPATKTPASEIDEAEWAAFERDVATPPPPDPFSNQTIISAAPISASELAEQEAQKAKEEGKAKPDQDMEDEKEDAARALEEEFEEMEGLEDRVRKLRDRREELRLKALEDPPEESETAQKAAADAEGESSDEDEDIDEWGFAR